jgi:SAM-dependent methyltransferase
VRTAEIEALVWQQEHHWWFRARRRVLRAVLECVAWEHAPRQVFDLGCGAAFDLAELAPPGAVRVGIERAVPALSAARGRLARAAPQGPAQHREREQYLFARADAAVLPLREASADLVFALDVLEHLEDDAAALREARRVLRPGGRLLLTVPAWPGLWSEHDKALDHRRRYRRADLLARLRAAGYEIERETYFNFLLFAPAALYRVLHRSLGGSVARRPEGRPPVSDTRRLGNHGGRLLEAVMAAERFWLKRGRLPLGLSLLALARRRSQGDAG